MATITGVGGSVTIPAAAGGQNISFGSWTAEETRDVHDVTGFDDAGNRRVKLGGIMRLRGTAEGIIEIDVDSSSPPATPSDGGMPTFPLSNDDGQPVGGFVLQTADGDTLTFAGRLGISPSADKRGLALCTVRFSSSGAVTHAA